MHTRIQIDGRSFRIGPLIRPMSYSSTTLLQISVRLLSHSTSSLAGGDLAFFSLPYTIPIM